METTAEHPSARGGGWSTSRTTALGGFCHGAHAPRASVERSLFAGELLGDFAGVGDLLDDHVVARLLHDARSALRRGLVSDGVHEPARVRADVLVLDQAKLHELEAAQIRALAQEGHA